MEDANRLMQPPAVYVVDDDSLVTESLSRALALETEWRVLAFNDGWAALEAMPANPPDAVLSDVKMPGLDGLAFLGRVRAQHADAVLMLLTGYADKESAIRAINEVGIWQYVEKPWELGDLILKIRQGLERLCFLGCAWISRNKTCSFAPSTCKVKIEA